MKLWKRLAAMPHVVHIAPVMVALVVSLAIAGCAAPQSDGEVRYTGAQRQRCDAEGGCFTITRKALLKMIEDVQRAAQLGGV